MKSFFSEDELALFDGLSDREKLAAAFPIIRAKDPNAKFRCQDICRFLGKDPQYPRGIYPMVQAIAREDETFPVDMVLVNQNGKKSFNKDKVAALKARFIPQPPMPLLGNLETIEQPQQFE